MAAKKAPAKPTTPHNINNCLWCQRRSHPTIERIPVSDNCAFLLQSPAHNGLPAVMFRLSIGGAFRFMQDAVRLPPSRTAQEESALGFFLGGGFFQAGF